MIALITFAPFQPTPGLAIWSLVIFLLFWFLAGKFAFKPIAEAIATREFDIQSSIDQAKKTREEMEKMQSDIEKLLGEAREERSKILQEAKEIKNQMISEGKEKAKQEAAKIAAAAMTDIENQKNAMMLDVKNEIGAMALSVAEKILKQDLQSNAEQQKLADTFVKDLNLN